LDYGDGREEREGCAAQQSRNRTTKLTGMDRIYRIKKAFILFILFIDVDSPTRQKSWDENKKLRGQNRRKRRGRDVIAVFSA
jgi:hypothetical protein